MSAHKAASIAATLTDIQRQRWAEHIAVRAILPSDLASLASDLYRLIPRAADVAYATRKLERINRLLALLGCQAAVGGGALHLRLPDNEAIVL